MEAEYEDKSDIKKESDEVARWLEEIDLALKTEKDWRKDAKNVWRVYRSESDAEVKKDTFNILWANVETKRQSIINSTPIPDIRRRYNDDDPVGMNVCEVLNRAITYTLDCQEGLHKLILCANDFLVPSRGQIRVRYKAHNSEDTAPEDNTPPEHEECLIEHVSWDGWIHGPGKEWSQVPWIGYIHEDVTKEDAIKKFGEEKAKKLNYTKAPQTGNKDDHDSDRSIFARTTIYEIWDKDSRKVYWIGKDYSDEYLEVIEDPLDLKNFFSSPRPAYSIEDPNSLIPIIEYGQYQTLARELEDITRRILMLVRACKVRGVYDSRISEIERVLNEDDTALVSASNAVALAEQGGLDKSIWFLPLEQFIITIQALQVQRVAVKQQIDELTGVSDIVRGSTNPNETATAQRIKASFASARLDKQKQAFQVFARDMIRLIAEVVCGFSRETLSRMTGLKFITNEEKQSAQQAIPVLQQRMQQVQMQSQQMGQQPPDMKQMEAQIQQMQTMAGQVTWEDIEEVLHSDMEREYRIDIETDSTMAADAQAEQEVYTSFMQGMAQFSTMAAQAMQVGLLSQPAAKSMMVAFARKFRLGKDVEEELEKPLPPPPPDPEAQKAQTEMQMKQQEFQMKQQGEQQKAQFEAQKMQMEMQKMQMEMEIEKEKARIEMERMQAEVQIERERLVIEREKLALSSQQTMMQGHVNREQHAQKMEAIDKKREVDSVA